MTPYGVMNFDNIGSWNGLSPDDMKPLLDPKLTKVGQLTKIIGDLDNGLVLNNRHANIWINIDIVHKYIYAPFNF